MTEITAIEDDTSFRLAVVEDCLGLLGATVDRLQAVVESLTDRVDERLRQP